jgi:NAD(P)-dependent dehydrogenase (short-subunit alcohol dehydrogenase family)
VTSVPTDLPAPVALVTGGARRIGAAIVRRLAADGFAVAIHCNGSRDEAEALAASLAPVRTVVIPADLADATAVDTIVARAVAALGPLTLLVNNASLFVGDDVASLGRALWDRQMAVNLRAPVFLAREFAAQAPQGSSIVNLLDQRVLKPTPEFISYTLSKAALHTATRTLAQALAPRIRVNGVAPGPTLPNAFDGGDGMAREIEGVPLRRSVDPREIADAVVWLARAPSVTGQTIAVDAGQSIGWRTPDIVT